MRRERGMEKGKRDAARENQKVRIGQRKERKGKKKKNITIKRNNFVEEDLKEKVKSFLTDKLKAEVKVQSAQIINKREEKNQRRIVRLAEWENKINIMAKKELNKSIYIEKKERPERRGMCRTSYKRNGKRTQEKG